MAQIANRTRPAAVLALLAGMTAATAPAAAESFGCLARSDAVLDLSEALSQEARLPDGTVMAGHELWFRDGAGNLPVTDGGGIDARGVTMVTPVPQPKSGKPWARLYPFRVMSGLRSVCIAGGNHLNRLPPEIGWHDSKGGLEGTIGGNSAAILFASPHTTVTGAFVSGAHDGIRPHSDEGSDARDWLVENSWLEYVRDDCIEADSSRGSGTLRDSLLDGCYAGISVRLKNAFDRSDDVFTLDRVLLRMEPMPFPYRWWERHRPDLIYTRPYDRPADNAGHRSESGIPFGHGPVFKLNPQPEANPSFVIRDSIFLFQQLYGSSFAALPPDELVAECRNVTVVWAGRESLEEFREAFRIPPACAGEVEITDDLGVWTAAVEDWHRRHPEVGREHKPEIAGDIRIPRWDRQPWPGHGTRP